MPLFYPEVVSTLKPVNAVVDHAHHLLVGIAAALLPVAPPAQALQVIDISSRAALRDRLNMVRLEQQIVTQPVAQAVQVVSRDTADLTRIIISLKYFILIGRPYPSSSRHIPADILLSR